MVFVYIGLIAWAIICSVGVGNVFAITRIMKVVLNVGAGESVVNKNVTTEIAKQITLIAGQKQ